MRLLIWVLSLYLHLMEYTRAQNKSTMNNSETMLHAYLFDGYNRDVLPKHPLSVIFDTQVIRILKVNERQQYIKVYLWVNQYWNNPMLSWNPADYGGTTSIHVSPELVWVPDIILYNSVDGNGQFSGGLEVYKHKVEIHYDGKNSWLNPVVFKKICQLDVSYFPFDDQRCLLKFGSWAHDASKLVIKASAKSTAGNSYYIPNGEWELLSVKTQENILSYQCCEKPFADVTVTIKIRRQAMNHALTLILPCALLSSLIVLGFILPPESGERIGLSITVLLAVTVFQQLTTQIMPPYDFPYLAQYYLATILQTAVSLVVTTLTLNFYHRTNRRMPNWVKKFLLGGLAPLLFCQRSKEKSYSDEEFADVVVADDLKKNGSIPEVLIDENSGAHFKNDEENFFEGSDIEAAENSKTATTAFNGGMSPKYKGRFKQKFGNLHLCRRMKRQNMTSAIRNSIHHTAFPLLGNEASKKAEIYENIRKIKLTRKKRAKEWMKAARVLDRFFFVLFVVISTITLLLIFFRAPRFSSHSPE